MSYSKISSIILWVVAGISLLVMLFFFAAPSTVDVDALEDERDKLLYGGDMAMQIETPVVDTTATDSTAVTEEGVSEEETSTEEEVAETAKDTVAAAVQEPVAPVQEEVITEDVNLKDHFSGWELMILKRTDYALIWAYILFAIAAISAVVFPLINIATNVKALIRVLIVAGAAAILILIGYFAFASGETINIIGYTGTENSNPSILKWVGTGLFVTYFLFGLTVISILYSEVVKLFK